MDYMELFGLNVNDPIFTKYQQSEMVRNLKEFLQMRQLYDAGIREGQTKL